MNLKKLVVVAGVVLLGIVIALPSSAIAKGPKGNGPAAKAMGPHEKATGDVSYDAYGVYRSLQFNAHEPVAGCQAGMVGDWVVSVDYGGQIYNHDMVITGQAEDGTLSGSGAYPAGGPYTITWTLVNSFVDGNRVWLELDYDGSDYVAFLEGFIGANGTIRGGSWSSTTGQAGAWRMIDGQADLNVCEGKGQLRYEDESGNWYQK